MDDEKPGLPGPEGEVSPPGDHSYGVYHEPYAFNPQAPPVSSDAPAATRTAAPPLRPPPPGDGGGDGDDPEDGMLRMSFLGHLEDLRSCIIRALYGFFAAFIVSLLFANKLWDIVSEPAIYALKHLGVVPPKLAMITPMEGFSVIWVKLPILTAIFIGSPWIVYQAWRFISPGLFPRERRWAAPMILTTAGLFIGGGLFAYFLAFRYGLEFLLGIGMSNNVQPVVTITEYFDLFVNVTLGISLVFELPIVIFFLTVLHIASPRFLFKNSRYAILAITVVAAVVTPTPDIFNMMLFAVPMTLLYFVGVFAGYIIVLRREGKSFPWGIVLGIIFAVLLVLAGAVYMMMTRYGYHSVPHWPFLTR
jgi:sec-independent protein translocase protein TatC